MKVINIAVSEKFVSFLMEVANRLPAQDKYHISRLRRVAQRLQEQFTQEHFTQEIILDESQYVVGEAEEIDIEELTPIDNPDSTPYIPEEISVECPNGKEGDC